MSTAAEQIAVTTAVVPPVALGRALAPRPAALPVPRGHGRRRGHIVDFRISYPCELHTVQDARGVGPRLKTNYVELQNDF